MPWRAKASWASSTVWTGRGKPAGWAGSGTGTGTGTGIGCGSGATAAGGVLAGGLAGDGFVTRTGAGGWFGVGAVVRADCHQNQPTRPNAARASSQYIPVRGWLRRRGEYFLRRGRATMRLAEAARADSTQIAVRPVARQRAVRLSHDNCLHNSKKERSLSRKLAAYCFWRGSAALAVVCVARIPSFSICRRASN